MILKFFLPVMLCLHMENTLGRSLPTLNEYFPSLKNDLTKVIWAHAVNSKSLLGKALDDDHVMMLEADVVMGTIDGQNDVLPIMAHPPSNTSDLSLQSFLQAVIETDTCKRKGVKLDFKSSESFENSWSVIDSVKSKINFPLFLNADILPGPVNSETKPVSPHIFFKLSKEKFPESSLSLGWTTKYGPGIVGKYTKEQLDNMKTLIQQNTNQSVTLCLRAGIVAQSAGIKDLVEEIDKYQQRNTTTVTIWMSTDSDPVDIPKLKNLIEDLGRNKVLLDVPKFISDELNLDTALPYLSSF